MHWDWDNQDRVQRTRFTLSSLTISSPHTSRRTLSGSLPHKDDLCKLGYQELYVRHRHLQSSFRDTLDIRAYTFLCITVFIYNLKEIHIKHHCAHFQMTRKTPFQESCEMSAIGMGSECVEKWNFSLSILYASPFFFGCFMKGLLRGERGYAETREGLNIYA